MPNPQSRIADHELLRKVGSGSYGEVWLARNVFKTFRAVKIVDRARFERARPFEREFQGIQRYEPISRTHHGLVEVLHVGRSSTEAEFFYYVMQVADDAEAGPLIDPVTYKPRTLASELDRRRRYTLAECAEIIEVLGGGLARLHDEGLVHRDIKPSNIIFVKGAPKLADIGLVTTINEMASNVGTPPYIPLEGPGTPTADIFSFGKMLYQMGTGNTVHAFPELPANLDARSVAEVMKLNEICLKACDPDPRRRYQSAPEMCAALALVARNGAVAIGPRVEANRRPALNAQPPALADSHLVSLRGFRVAILCQPNTQFDGEIADLLERELRACQCTVFVDRQQKVGFDWALATDAEIRRANAVIVLLSKASVNSEMFAWGVETAHQSREETGRPLLLSVRVRFDDTFPDALEPFIASLNCVKWAGSEDNERLIEVVIQALVTSKQAPEKKVHPPLEPPGGAVPLGSSFYVVRPTDHEFQTAIARRDGIVLVKGARQMGKTSLLARGLEHARQSGDNVVPTDLQKLNTVQLVDIGPFLQSLGDSLASHLKLDVLPVDVWDTRRGANTNFENYLRREVFSKISGHLVWGLDEIDRLFACGFGGEVFGLFRSWHNERAADPSSPFSRLTLAMVYSTEAYLFITDLNQSPFNVGTRLDLEDFSFEQMADLSHRYGSPLKTTAEVQRLFTLLGGQPYLVRLGLNELTAGNVTFAQLLVGAARDEGIFGDHLRRLLVVLARDPELADAVRHVLQGRPCPSDASFYRLRSAGVLKGDVPARAQIRCEIYASYLKPHLK